MYEFNIITEGYQITDWTRTDVSTTSSTYAKHIFCAVCDAPAYIHDGYGEYTEDGQRIVCERKAGDIILSPINSEEHSFFDYTSQGNAYEVEFDEQVEDPYLPDNTSPEAWEQIDRYVDQFPDERTSALDWTYINTRTGETKGRAYDDNAPQRELRIAAHLDSGQSRNVLIEGEWAVTVEVFDLNTTEAYHKRLLNTYTDKYGQHRVGSIVLKKHKEAQVYTDVAGNPRLFNTEATCLFCEMTLKVKNTLRIHSAFASREEMEQFTYSVIRHGNNHGPDFIRTRDDFYKLHAEDCDLTCDAKAAHCKPTLVSA